MQIKQKQCAYLVLCLIYLTSWSANADDKNDGIGNLFGTAAPTSQPAVQVQVPVQTAQPAPATAPVVTDTTQPQPPAPVPAGNVPVQNLNPPTQPVKQIVKKEPPPEFAVWPDMVTPDEAAAFKAAGQSAQPLSPAEIIKYKAAAQAAERAAVKQSLTPINISIPLTLEPGSLSPEIKIAANHGTSLILLDSSGNPWPVQSGFAPGTNDMIDVVETKSAVHNVFIVAPKTGLSFVDTNLTFPLKPLTEAETSLPLTVRIVTTEDGKYHEHVELRVQRAGPNAPAAVVGNDLPNVVDPVYQTVLDGIPVGMVRRKTDAPGIAVWEDRKQKLLYLRSNYRLISPSHDKEGQSADGTWAYRITLAPRLIFVTNAGERVHVKVIGVGDE